MESAASVAGLLGLAGLAIQGVTSLRTFFWHYKESDENVSSLLDDLQALQRALEHVCASQHRDTSASSSLISSLRGTILDCNRDLETWVRETDKLRVNKGKNFKKFQNKAKTALDHEKLTTIRSKVSSYRERLVLLLEVLGREYDVQHHHDLHAINTMQRSNHVELTSNLNTIQTGVDCLQLTTASLIDMESRIDLMQQLLVKSLSRRPNKLHRDIPVKKLNRRRHPKSSISSTTSKAGPTEIADRSDTCLIKVIKTAILVQEANGKPIFELLAKTDGDYDNASNAAKIAMIQQLQGIRLIAWLLRSDNLLTASYFVGNSVGSTVLGTNGALTTSYHGKIVAQGIEHTPYVAFEDSVDLHQLWSYTWKRDVRTAGGDYSASQHGSTQLVCSYDSAHIRDQGIDPQEEDTPFDRGLLLPRITSHCVSAKTSCMPFAVMLELISQSQSGPKLIESHSQYAGNGQSLAAAAMAPRNDEKNIRFMERSLKYAI